MRFIFGATRKSRKLAKKIGFLGVPIQNRDKIFGKLIDGDLDHLLCSPLAASGSKKLVENEFLTPSVDCPLLGERFLQLQRYNEQQRPTKTSSMIRDKRNPAQWYTLWVVLFVGGLSVILSALQLAVGIAQLAVAK